MGYGYQVQALQVCYYDDDMDTRKCGAKYHAAYHGQFDQYVMLNVDGVLSSAVE